MTCHYCGRSFGTAISNYNEDRRIETDRGDVHMRCLAYWIQELGMERAFGSKLSSVERSIVMSRLRLPTPQEDASTGTSRYRGVKATGAHVGANTVDVVNHTKRLMRRLERRASRLAGKDDSVREAREHLEHANKLLDELAL